ncbi:NADP-dependent fatty aldehyde dehydrogenase [Tsuneonella dongtanensis]|uniref:NADP-dependent fatty aldehyde dehydrogenase n=1 Tax=Tsuneonella dongtanensis TaxID=692370 RepID=A0A1B2AB18_9SPHN|nr:aldehyde dehydrogenase (NADP(+)) [Tsuneonella dongtanensis]ANY19360.1 NADP-dependent fatty aldehyde dehydrogenase [Tsuneonella dongtanensis]
MQLTGDLLIASEYRSAPDQFHGRNAASGARLDPPFSIAGAADVEDACAAAEAAQREYASRPLAERAAFLRACAEEIDALGDTLTARAMAESGLPEARLVGERGRTVGQLRLFAAEVEDGGWQALRIDHADPARTPPKPDLRLRMVPLGPVAVFGASNFPLAFSVAGGDTAAALAAGCCVVVKAHPAHPGTSELVAGAIALAVEKTGMPKGVFSMVAGPANELGAALVADPRIAAVGFTGSRAGGTALMRIAAERTVPIPVYAEMSSINPVILMPSKLAEQAEALGAAYVGSLSLGAGQFCTNPGVVLAVEGDALDRFLAAAGEAIAGVAGQTMLTAGIHGAFVEGTERLAGLPGARLVARGSAADTPCGEAQLYTVSASDFLAEPHFAEEVFGPVSVVVRCADIDELTHVLESMEGQLTATLHLSPADHEAASMLIPLLERKAGRIIANGWPTGVEVAHAMNHGGPYPATSDGRSTSVGTLAIDRFLRPVAYQDMPESLLPDGLREAAATGLRRVDGAWLT